jgi:RNA polymerase sigma-70 factor, ECF subfamily
MTTFPSPPAPPEVGSPPGPSFEELLDPVLSPAYRLALGYTGNGPDAEDLVQEACLLAWRGFASFQTGTNFRAWFLRILTNAHFSRYRKVRRAPEGVDLDDVNQHHLLFRAAENGLLTRDDPVGDLMDALTVDRVMEAIQALPEEFAGVTALFFLEELSYPEISSLLGIPVGTVRSRLHRGRKMLQKTLWTLARDSGVVAALQKEER